MSSAVQKAEPGPLGDGPARDYARKLRRFDDFAAAELGHAVDALALQPGMRVVDAGCGTGGILRWLRQAVGPGGTVAGLDLSRVHAAAARRSNPPTVAIVQASLAHPPFRNASFDLVWCANAIHHLADPTAAALTLRALVRPGGRLALAQSFLVPELLFAWDARLDRRVTDAVHRYYQERYGIADHELSGVRGLVGLARRLGLQRVTARTQMIERIAPLAPADTDYLIEALFGPAWCERLRPYLGTADWSQLESLCDPHSSQFALAREDFHYLQSFTVVTGVA